MTPRPSKPSSESTNPGALVGVPLSPPATQGHDFHAQAVFNIHGQVAKLENGLSNIESRLSKVETKLDGVATDVTAGKATFDTLKWVLGVVGAVCAALLAAILGVLVNHFSKH